jgi:hypothetical protein
MMLAATGTEGRWDSYVLDHGESLRSFWSGHLAVKERSVLLVLGRGFDPRMNLGLKLLLESGARGRLTLLGLVFDDTPHQSGEEHADRVRANWSELEALTSGAATLLTRPVRLWSDDGTRRRAAQSAAEVLSDPSELAPFTDLVVDISALPRSLFFPLIAQLLRRLDDLEYWAGAGRTPPNLHVLVAEDPVLDREIREQGVDHAAEYLHSFSGGFHLEADAHLPRVWIPILGEGQLTQLDRIHDLVKPSEISPVIPSPSLDPRRGDDLVIEYHRLLFEELEIDPRNIIYAAERNPFEVYRQLGRTIRHYRRALRPLGGCKFALSALSSKLISTGALLVAYELRPDRDVGVAHIECQGYSLPETGTRSELFGLWLSGECYER